MATSEIKGLFMKQVETIEAPQVTKVFVVCDRSDTAPVWGYILRQQGLSVILELRP